MLKVACEGGSVCYRDLLVLAVNVCMWVGTKVRVCVCMYVGVRGSSREEGCVLVAQPATLIIIMFKQHSTNLAVTDNLGRESGVC